ncbi:uncharacterized protein LOC135098416 [Scylla paramamosain]|uniref:uncharacterized protein LOC135098416 n=1 Tax=Scylla paramamosain TaxID=85552 RepID=UPI0030830291
MSHELNLDAFCSNPSVAELQTAKVTKDDLKYIARQFDLSYPSDIRKEELRTQILVHLGGKATSAASQHDASLMLELEKLKLMAAREEREAAREREREERELRREELAFEKEKAERDLAYVKEKEEKEREEKEKEREEREKERIHETQLTQLKSRSTTTADLKQKLTKYLSLLPQFSDKDPETFFGQFEDTAVHFELPREDWPWLLKPKLSQKALTILNGLENNTDYDCVKQGIQAAYSITTEGYRQSFRKMFKTPQQTYLEFASEKPRALKRWLKSAAITTYDELVNLLALEEFMRKLPYSVMLHITNKEETDLLKAAQLADLFSLVNRKATSDKLTETPSGWSSHECSGPLRSQNVLSRLQEANLTVKLAKSTFGAATVSYLGHQIGQGSVRPKTANVDAVLKYPTPTTRRELRRFLGMAGFYRRFCPNFADAAGPLTRLTCGNVAYEWTPACQHAFNQLKNLLAREPVLRAADFSKPFIIHTDASDHASGAALLQESDGIFHPVAYHSEKFNIHQKNYSTIEKELLAIISAIKKFEYYLQSNTQPLQIYTDHNNQPFDFSQQEPLH